MPPLRFKPADLLAFSAASHDRNPLHLSDEYSRNTSFGAPVVFGMLTGLAMWGAYDDGRGLQLVEALFDFRLPLFTDRDYRIEMEEGGPDSQIVALYAGPQLHLRASFVFKPPGPKRVVRPTNDVRVVPASWSHEALETKPSLAGTYGPGPGLEALLTSLRLGASDPAQMCVLMWCSYFIGMEMPGDGAAFSQARVVFTSPSTGEPGSEGVLDFKARVSRFDRRFALMDVHAELAVSDGLFATVQLRSFLEQRVPVSSVATLRAWLGEGRPLEGQTALVIGGSRGLGASIAQALVLGGAHVFLNFPQSLRQAERVVRDLPSTARVELLPGDAGDQSWCGAARKSIERTGRGLDILVCSASPPLHSMAISEETISDLEEYVASSLRLASRPIGTFLPMLRSAAGCLTIISSPVVLEAVPIWPHYVAAKHALEGLARAVVAAAPEIRALIVRPPRLRTEFANTPLARSGAMAPELVASRIVARVADTIGASGEVSILDTFSEGSTNFAPLS